MIDVQPASKDSRARVRELLSECLNELGAYGPVEPAYPYFDAYWSADAARWPYLLWLGDQTVGFAFVNTHSPSGLAADFSMAEFYVRPSVRRHGVGRTAAKNILLKHKGLWELAIMRGNTPASLFWPKVILAAGGCDAQYLEHKDKFIHRFLV